jgi:hypothetical protein
MTDAIVRRERFWLMGTSATTPEGLRYLFPRFKKDLLENPKSHMYTWYKRAIERQDFGKINLLNWFKDMALRYHYNDWYTERIRTNTGYMLNKVDEEAMSEIGYYVYAKTQWGPVREVFMTPQQHRVFERFKYDKEVAEIEETIRKEIGQE